MYCTANWLLMNPDLKYRNKTNMKKKIIIRCSKKHKIKGQIKWNFMESTNTVV